MHRARGPSAVAHLVLLVLAHLRHGATAELRNDEQRIVTEAAAPARRPRDEPFARSLGDLDVGSLEFDAGGTVSGGDITVAGYVTGEAQGAVTLGDINAGGIHDDNFSVAISSATSLDVGNVTGVGSVVSARLTVATRSIPSVAGGLTRATMTRPTRMVATPTSCRVDGASAKSSGPAA